MVSVRKIATIVTLGLAAVVALPTIANAVTNTETVREADIVRQAHGTDPSGEDNWVLYSRDTGTGTFREGPATAPVGTGSLELTTTTGNDKVYLFNYDHVGTALKDINAISYSTYRTTGNLQQVAALNVEVDYNGPGVAGGYTTLVFEPVYNTIQGAVVTGEWQSWDAFNGGNAVWWSSKNIPGVVAFDGFVSWNDILAANPDAVILGGFGVNQGGGNPGVTSAVDKLTIGTDTNTVTYDFELAAPVVKPVKAATKDECKNEGWKNGFQTQYKNQGDCVSSVASNGKAKGNPTPDSSVVTFFRSLF